MRPRIVHLGLGAFYRAHVALYGEDVLDQKGGDWGIVGASLQRSDLRDRLAPQDNLYLAVERSGVSDRFRIVRSLLGVHFAPENPGALVSRLGDPATDIVTLTVTEKGYCLDRGTGRLDEHHPDIVNDRSNPDKPRTAVGFLAAALRRRRMAGLAPFTIMSCDNLPANGRLLKTCVTDFLALSDESTAKWVEANGAFPSTLVDRIVPATTTADVEAVTAATGLCDRAPVIHEPFRQWVIEDCFVRHDRPAWEDVGAELVSDVTPYETMKLRLLNGAHSALAYPGYLAGYETVSEALADTDLRNFVRALWAETAPTLEPPPGFDVQAYVTQVEQRFANPGIRHRTWQIASDGSQKLPQRLLAPAEERLMKDLPVPCVAVVVASWIVYVGGTDLHGRAIDVRDSLASNLRAAITAAGDVAGKIHAALAFKEIFGEKLPADRRFVDAVTAAYVSLTSEGGQAAARRAANGMSGQRHPGIAMDMKDYR